MGERLHRTQILLEPEQHRALSEIAEREGRSISDVVREIIRQQLDKRKMDIDEAVRRDLEVLERIRKDREAILQRRSGKPIEIDTVELIEQMRKDRDERNLAGLINSGD